MCRVHLLSIVLIQGQSCYQFSFCLYCLFANNYITYGLLGVFTILVVMVSQVPLYFILKGMKPILWIVLFTFILHIFMTKDGALLFHFGFLNIYEEGLKQGFSFHSVLSISS